MIAFFTPLPPHFALGESHTIHSCASRHLSLFSPRIGDQIVREDSSFYAEEQTSIKMSHARFGHTSLYEACNFMLIL